jgi:hypothetical protein
MRMTKQTWGATAQTFGAKLDLWWGITRRVTVAVIKGRSVAYCELKSGDLPTLTIMGGKLSDMQPLSEAVYEHACATLRMWNAQEPPKEVG